MAGTKVGDIVSDVIVELSQVPGIATQLYASGRITQFVQDAYQLEMIDNWWPGYMTYFTVPLDGTTGRLAQDLKGPISTVDTFEDIKIAWPEGSDRRVRILPSTLNPSLLTAGAAMLYMAPDYLVPNRPLRVWPNATTGNIVLFAQQHTSLPLDPTSVLYLDRLLMTYDAAWMYCVDDGTVPAQVQKYQMLAAKRRKQIITSQNQQPSELDSRFPEDVSAYGWFTLDQTPLA